MQKQFLCSDNCSARLNDVHRFGILVPNPLQPIHQYRDAVHRLTRGIFKLLGCGRFVSFWLGLEYLQTLNPKILNPKLAKFGPSGKPGPSFRDSAVW